jgi:hypothetical protein
MKKQVKAIYHKFDGKLVGSPYMKVCVCETLEHVPEEIVNYITAHCWFISSMKDAWAFAFAGNDIANQYLIFLSEDLLKEDIHQITYTIIHEIGHIMLGHKNSVQRIQTQSEIKQQEREADEFARKYIR